MTTFSQCVNAVVRQEMAFSPWFLAVLPEGVCVCVHVPRFVTYCTVPRLSSKSTGRKICFREVSRTAPSSFQLLAREGPKVGQTSRREALTVHAGSLRLSSPFRRLARRVKPLLTKKYVGSARAPFRGGSPEGEVLFRVGRLLKPHCVGKRCQSCVDSGGFTALRHTTSTTDGKNRV